LSAELTKTHSFRLFFGSFAHWVIVLITRCINLITSVFLPAGVSKKNKIVAKGNKVKREDDEEDAEIMQEKMSALASLGGKLKKSLSFLSFIRSFSRF